MTHLKYNFLYFFDGKAEFSAAIADVIHDPSEIILIRWFVALETFIIINVKNSFTACRFFGNSDTPFIGLGYVRLLKNPRNNTSARVHPIAKKYTW